MFEISTYIKYKKQFISIENFSHNFNIFRKIDKDYIEGAIKLSYYSKKILGLEHWDYIDELWFYIINMVEEYLSKNFSEMFFPDQPVSLSIKNQKNNMCLLKINSNADIQTFYVPDKELIKSLVNECENFLCFAKKCFGLNMLVLEFKLSKIKSEWN